MPWTSSASAAGLGGCAPALRQAAVELALQRAARVAADHAQAAADLARGPCKGTSAGRP